MTNIATLHRNAFPSGLVFGAPQFIVRPVLSIILSLILALLLAE